MAETDGVRETVDEVARAAIMLAATIARRVQARRYRELLEAQRESREAARTLAAEQAGERALAAARASVAREGSWWTADRTPQEAAGMWQPLIEVIRRDEQTSSQVTEAASRIAFEAQRRWGVDVEALSELARAQELAREQATLGTVIATDPELASTLDRDELADVQANLQAVGVSAPSRDVSPGPADLAPSPTPAALATAREPEVDRLTALRTGLEAHGVTGDALEARMLAEAAFPHGPEHSLGAGDLARGGQRTEPAHARELNRRR